MDIDANMWLNDSEWTQDLIFTSLVSGLLSAEEVT